jgi:AraC-like DNA-binding protein
MQQGAHMAQTSSNGGDSSVLEEFDVVHARVLRFFPDLVAQLGGDLQGLLQRAEIRRDECLSEGDAAITYRQMIRLIELAAEQLRCPDFGMRLATLQSGSSMFGPLGLAMKNSTTFGDALDYVSKHTYAHSLAARVRLRRSPSRRTVFVGHDILLEGISSKSQALEQIMLLGHLAALEMTGRLARVRQVHFRHQPVSSLRVYSRYFGCAVRFGQDEDGVVFSERDLACPIIHRDSKVYLDVTSFIDAKFTQHSAPAHAQTRGMIMQLLGTDHCTNDQIADALNLHPRTLRRHLVAEGTSFQQVKDQVRRDALLYYLQQTDLAIAVISDKLGFAEQSVLTRTCKRWFCACPTELRAQGRASFAC